LVFESSEEEDVNLHGLKWNVMRDA
jgi:hypothetical protein